MDRVASNRISAVLVSTDMERSQRFYETKVGLTFSAETIKNHLLFECGKRHNLWPAQWEQGRPHPGALLVDRHRHDGTGVIHASYERFLDRRHRAMLTHREARSLDDVRCGAASRKRSRSRSPATPLDTTAAAGRT